jgi:hypothetical protein
VAKVDRLPYGRQLKKSGPEDHNAFSVHDFLQVLTSIFKMQKLFLHRDGAFAA